jgi:hypothetical protein
MGYISNKHSNCIMWQGGLFEQGSFVVLGRSYKKAKVVGSCGLGKNFVMLKLEEVGKVSDNWVPIHRMMVSTHPSPETYQLSFHQCLHFVFLEVLPYSYWRYIRNDDLLRPKTNLCILGS